MTLPTRYTVDASKLSRDYQKFPLADKERPSKEDLLYLYLDLNLSLKDVGIYFKRSRHLIPQWTKFYSIKKPKHLQVALAEHVWLEKYGVKSARQAPEVKEKIRATMIERYGRDNIFKGEEGKAFAAERCFNKLGRKNSFSGVEGRRIAEEGVFKKYGVRQSNQVPEIKAKAVRTNLARYGVKNTFQLAKKSPTSKKEGVWLDTLNILTRGFKIYHTEGVFTTDGYDKTTNTVYEFLGDYWHGNLNRFKTEDLNILKNQTYKQLNDSTFRRFNQIKALGFKIKYVWEADFDEDPEAFSDY